MTTRIDAIRPFVAPPPAAAADVRRAVEDYYKAWFDADPDRLARVLHPQLAKRGWLPGERGEHALDLDTAETMVEWTRQGVGRRDVGAVERRLEIDVLEVYEDIATVLVHTPRYVESLQLVRTVDGWRILNALWRAP